MKLEEALDIISDKYPDFNILSVVDYDNFYVFSIVPKSHNTNQDGTWFGGLIAVDKVKKITLNFNPLLHDPSAYAKAVNDTIKWI